MEAKLKVIQKSAEVMGGTPVFENTRVPIQALFDFLEAGDTINEFLLDFPTVTKDQVLEVMEYIRKQISDVA
ncbi:DUF433 domain-containing protein [Bdellovibrionota bacterium FG-1]